MSAYLDKESYNNLKGSYLQWLEMYFTLFT